MKMRNISKWKGDGGDTDLWKLGRTRKTDSRIIAVGKIDSLNAQLGACKKEVCGYTFGYEITEKIIEIQNTLFSLMAEVNSNEESIGLDDLEFLKSECEIVGGLLDDSGHTQNHWSLYGDGNFVTFDIATTVCREAEISVLQVIEDKTQKESFSGEKCAAYLNRLSKYTYLLGRYTNHQFPKN